MFIRGSGPNKECSGVHFKMQSVLERYLEKEGINTEEDQNKE
jgi:hypothetical protein